MTGKFAITMAEIDLGPVIDEAVSAVHPMAAAKGLQSEAFQRFHDCAFFP